jgi:hypothetical protein
VQARLIQTLLLAVTSHAVAGQVDSEMCSHRHVFATLRISVGVATSSEFSMFATAIPYATAILGHTDNRPASDEKGKRIGNSKWQLANGSIVALHV